MHVFERMDVLTLHISFILGRTRWAAPSPAAREEACSRWPGLALSCKNMHSQ